MGEFCVGHEEDRNHFRIEVAVHPRQLELEFDIADKSQSANQGHGALLLSEFHDKAIIRGDVYTIELFRRFAYHIHPFIHVEEWFLVPVRRHRHNDTVEQFDGPFDDIEMPSSDRIKGAGVDGYTRSVAQRVINASCVSP